LESDWKAIGKGLERDWIAIEQLESKWNVIKKQLKIFGNAGQLW